MNHAWRRAALAATAGAAALTVTSVSLPIGADSAAADPILPLPQPSLSVSVSLPPVKPPSITLPSVTVSPLRPPILTRPSPTPSGSPTGSRPSTPASPAAPRSTTAPDSPAAPAIDPDSAATVITDDPGADLYPQPPVDAAVTPQARQVAALTEVQHRIQYLQNILARTRDDLDRVQREPDPVLQLLTALTAGGAPGDPPPIAVADAADLVDTPTGRAAALSAAITSGQAELGRRQREETTLRQEIDRRARSAVVPAAAPNHEETTRGGGRLGRPVAGRLTSGYGVRFDPYYHVWQRHPGVDLAAPAGTPIVAAMDGRVTRAGWYGGYGNYTCIDHGRADGQRLSTCYGHQSRLLVSPGQRVRAGQVIGLVGSTGASTGPHLHFEVRLGGRAVDPLPWL
ncbi:peptidoglycan DD-metalloendopeptidase family protein [Micromonospora soli]|uniref:peptidoglycan DD-metalloendopeptidase family protein n=1 Tax=Micromonospora sp. NBRC 110009 TaxID=3061627 RepID=UPI00267364F8|nr:peptidoglycan DD-metalloendopeptidase family protein [Micromonospora sp. NBRC 110009]WKT97374.1 peptidoglycan DD-metalloendopeptidase family protein [Micromonospora sp. NBRC 110009]